MPPADSRATVPTTPIPCRPDGTNVARATSHRDLEEPNRD